MSLMAHATHLFYWPRGNNLSGAVGGTLA